jgi:hypothetical protein
MQHLQLMGVFIERFNSLMRKPVVGDIEFVKEQVATVEHLLQSVISDVVVDEVKHLKPLRKVFGNVEEHLITDFAAVEFEMFEVGIGFKELIDHVFVYFRKIKFQHLSYEKLT